MFTGIVEHLGTVVGVTELDRGRRLTIDAGPLRQGLSVGDSVAVNGACLTAAALNGETVSFEVVGETLDRTNLSDSGPGDRINLELALAAAGRFDGHIVQGHIDGVGIVSGIEGDGAGKRMWVRVPTHLAHYLVEKGSVTVDGVSLTIASLDAASFEVALIPHTLAATTLGSRRPGEGVNLEVDLVAKYVERMLGPRP